MKSRHVIVVAVALVAGCGIETGSKSQVGADQPGSNPPALGPVVGTVRPLLLASTTPVKIALNQAGLVYNAVTVYDGATDTDVPVACAGASTAGCPTGTTICYNSVCSAASSVTSQLYKYITDNATVTATGVQVPCDGGLYTAEVYGAQALPANPSKTDVYNITETHITKTFKMSTGCVVQDPVTNATLTDLWTTDNNPIAQLGLTFDTIYAGLAAVPTFKVNLTGWTYPWTNANWSVTYPGAAAGSTVSPTYSGVTATFASPTSGTSLTFTANVSLDSSLAVSGDRAWQWQMVKTQNVVATGGIGTP